MEATSPEPPANSDYEHCDTVSVGPRAGFYLDISYTVSCAQLLSHTDEDWPSWTEGERGNAK